MSLTREDIQKVRDFPNGIDDWEWRDEHLCDLCDTALAALDERDALKAAESGLKAWLSNVRAENERLRGALREAVDTYNGYVDATVRHRVDGWHKLLAASGETGVAAGERERHSETTGDSPSVHSDPSEPVDPLVRDDPAALPHPSDADLLALVAMGVEQGWMRWDNPIVIRPPVPPGGMPEVYAQIAAVALAAWKERAR